MKRLRTCFLLIMVMPQYLAAGMPEHVNPDTGLSSWKTAEQGFSMELIQVLPDYIRAVYASRGLPQTIIDTVSSYCVFGTILKNTAALPLSYDVGKWRYITADGKTHRARLKSEWVQEWRDMGVAFRWSLLPEQQTYAAGDWGQGFTTVALPHGTTFDLHYTWEQDDATHTGTIREVRCAPADIEQK